jgi:hypothetical protein
MMVRVFDVVRAFQLLEVMKPGAGGELQLGSRSVDACRTIGQDVNAVKWMLLSFKAGLFLASTATRTSKCHSSMRDVHK